METFCFRQPLLPSLSRLPLPSPHQNKVQVCATVAETKSHNPGVESERRRRSSYITSRPLGRLWPMNQESGSKNFAGNDDAEEEEDEDEVDCGPPPVQRGRWVVQILRIRSIWEGKKAKNDGSGGGGGAVDANRMMEESDRCVGCCCAEGSEGCDVGGEEEEEGEVEIDKELFSRFLRRASLPEAKLYAKLSYLGCLAYSIPRIKAGNLLKYHGLRFVTSSLEKKAKSSSAEGDQSVVRNRPADKEEEAKKPGIENRNRVSASGTYQIVASAASYLQNQTKSILPFGHKKMDDAADDSPENDARDGIGDGPVVNSAKASFFVTTDSVTAVVAGKEEMKEAFSKELNSSRSSPCEWFICDEDSSGTRYFVIQGSESLASWQANLLFEPIQFEGLDVLVHRGIYEAAKGIYDQMLPEIQSHLESRGKTATLRFTGHSLGGSLSLLVNLMLLIRGEAPASSLLPVITYGAPSIMCGGNHLLQKLGLPLSHVQAITMHRDIVPRAFSCTYPDHVTEILKAVNGNFRTHPCLKHQKLLYSTMGEILILQPDEKFSPHHHLLPSGSGLYFFSQPSESSNSRKLLRPALSAFLNSPHPLEILSDRSAYGSTGAVNRDHDMSSYLRSVRCVIRLELKRIRKAKRELRRRQWWPLLTAEGSHAGNPTGKRSKLKNSGPLHRNFSGMFQGGRESLKRFTRTVASWQLHVIIAFLLPARLLLLEAVMVRI